MRLDARMSRAMEALMHGLSGEGSGWLADRALFLGARVDAQLHGLGVEWTGWQPLKPWADEWESAGWARVDEVPCGCDWPLVVLLPGKARDEVLAGFAMARDAVAQGGRIVVAMDNGAGAARFEKELARAVGAVERMQKHKCRVFSAIADGSWNGEIFDTWRMLGDPAQVKGTRFVTEAGVFSAGRVDAGSAMLVDHLPASLAGKVADLGAGWGFLSAMALEKCPGIEEIDLYEADARALRCARRNVPDARAVFNWSDVTRGVAGDYDVVLMNPPFHTGQETDVALGVGFVKAAAEALRRGGRLCMVANRQLPYESVVDAAGMCGRLIAQSGVHKVIFAEKR